MPWSGEYTAKEMRMQSSERRYWDDSRGRSGNLAGNKPALLRDDLCTSVKAGRRTDANESNCLGQWLPAAGRDLDYGRGRSEIGSPESIRKNERKEKKNQRNKYAKLATYYWGFSSRLKKVCNRWCRAGQTDCSSYNEANRLSKTTHFQPFICHR